MRRSLRAVGVGCVILGGVVSVATADVDPAKIRRDRLNVLLPRIMAEQEIDVWLTFTRENTLDPILTVIGVDDIVARGAFVFARKEPPPF